jgi:hypothetical protein
MAHLIDQVVTVWYRQLLVNNRVQLTTKSPPARFSRQLVSNFPVATVIPRIRRSLYHGWLTFTACMLANPTLLTPANDV